MSVPRIPNSSCERAQSLMEVLPAATRPSRTAVGMKGLSIDTLALQESKTALILSRAVMSANMTSLKSFSLSFRR
ncbi:hypothetical protein D3C72_1039630 [compost metagenome]